MDVDDVNDLIDMGVPAICCVYPHRLVYFDRTKKFPEFITDHTILLSFLYYAHAFCHLYKSIHLVLRLLLRPTRKHRYAFDKKLCMINFASFILLN